MEDPLENPFTETITFQNHSYIVIPWNIGENTFIFRHLIKALFSLNEPFPNTEFSRRASMLISAVLFLSNEIALNAGLKRGMEPATKNKKIHIPDIKRLLELKNAVTFNLSQLESKLSNLGIELSVLQDLILLQGRTLPIDYDVDNNELLSKPMIKVNDKIIVAIPGMLLSAARNEIIRLAKKYGIKDKLAERYNLAVWNTIIEELSYLENDVINFSGCTNLTIPCSRDSFFIFDKDKLIYALTITDDLNDYHETSRYWTTDDIGVKIKERFNYVKNFALTLPKPPNEILFLLLVQGIGRGYVLKLGKWTDSMLCLAMSAAYLETIAFLEGGKTLVLWKYAIARRDIRKDKHVKKFGELDELYVYRNNGYSYNIPGNSEYNALFISPGCALDLRMEVIRKIDCQRSIIRPRLHQRGPIIKWKLQYSFVYAKRYHTKLRLLYGSICGGLAFANLDNRASIYVSRSEELAWIIC